MVSAAALPGNAWLWVAVGCAVELAGIGLRVRAIHALGDQFTRHLEVGEEHRLVDDGPYRHLRHPAYTGAILMYTGVGIGLGNALSMLAFALLPTIGYVQRTRARKHSCEAGSVARTTTTPSARVVSFQASGDPARARRA